VVVRRRAYFVGAFVATATWAGCAYDWSFPAGLDPTNPDGGNGPETSKESSTSDVTRPDVDEKDATPPTVSCKDNSGCKGTEYCRFDDHSCGLTGVLGKCALPETTNCSIPGPVCTCKGNFFNSSCEASQKLEDPGPGPTCAKNTAGYFLCGYAYCKSDAEFCIIEKSLTGATKYSCGSMDGCSPVNCAPCTAPGKYINSMTGSDCNCSLEGTSAVTVVCAQK